MCSGWHYESIQVMSSSVISLRTVSGGIYSLLLPAWSMSNPSNISSFGGVRYRGKPT